jgi:hypothetical protein
MKLKIRVAGRYNNAQHRAGNYDEGETLDTAQEYGQILVDEGFAEEIQDLEADADESDDQEGAKKKKAPATRQSKSRVNPFKPEG